MARVDGAGESGMIGAGRIAWSDKGRSDPMAATEPRPSKFKIPPGFKAIRLKPDDTPFFGWQTENTEPDDDYRSMGKVARKGYGLVDTDPRNNARIDDELVAKYGEELISGWVERTPGGGFHIPVRLPEDLWDMPQSQNGGGSEAASFAAIRRGYQGGRQGLRARGGQPEGEGRGLVHDGAGRPGDRHARSHGERYPPRLGGEERGDSRC